MINKVFMLEIFFILCSVFMLSFFFLSIVVSVNLYAKINNKNYGCMLITLISLTLFLATIVLGLAIYLIINIDVEGLRIIIENVSGCSLYLDMDIDTDLKEISDTVEITFNLRDNFPYDITPDFTKTSSEVVDGMMKQNDNELSSYQKRSKEIYNPIVKYFLRYGISCNLFKHFIDSSGFDNLSPEIKQDMIPHMQRLPFYVASLEDDLQQQMLKDFYYRMRRAHRKSSADYSESSDSSEE